uniref:Uncharacterized protein n=1 Tax=Lygus hesperus TaxID=30085 RepID=A0A146LLP9_LYGHE
MQKNWREIARMLELLLQLFTQYSVVFLHRRICDIEPDIRCLLYTATATFYLRFPSLLTSSVVEDVLLPSLCDPECGPVVQSLQMWQRLLRDTEDAKARELLLRHCDGIQTAASAYVGAGDGKLCASAVRVCCELLLLDSLRETECVSGISQLLWDADPDVQYAATLFVYEDSFSPKVQNVTDINENPSQNDWIEFSKLLHTCDTEWPQGTTPQALQRQKLSDTLVTNFARYTNLATPHDWQSC